MTRELFCWEWKKLWLFPMFPVFLVLCMAFNTFLIVSGLYGQEYVSYIATVTPQTGGQMGAAFDRRLEALPEHEYKDILHTETENAEDTLEHYSTEDILNILSGLYRLNDTARALLAGKYERLQKEADVLAKEDASLSVFAAGETYHLQGSLFQTLCRAIITESGLMAILMALYLSGSEALSGTVLSVYSTKTGRSLQNIKYAASILASLLSYLVLAGCGIVAFHLLWNMGDIWQANMSSQFNYRQLAIAKIPFLTWTSFTVAEYLAAMLALGIVLILIFHLLSFGIGMLVRDTYRAFLLLAGGGILSFTASFITANGAGSTNFILRQLLEWSPVMLWWNQYKWFTDMDLSSILPWQECLVALFCMIASALLWLLCRRHFNRKDIA